MAITFPKLKLYDDGNVNRFLANTLPWGVTNQETKEQIWANMRKCNFQVINIPFFLQDSQNPANFRFSCSVILNPAFYLCILHAASNYAFEILQSAWKSQYVYRLGLLDDHSASCILHSAKNNPTQKPKQCISPLTKAWVTG